MFKYLQDVLLHRLWRETSINKGEPKKSGGNRFDVTKGKISINPKILAPAGNERHDVENSKEVVKIKRTYDMLMKKFVNPNLDLTPSGMKPFEHSKFQNFKRKYELLKTSINSVLDKKSTRKLPPLPDNSESDKGETSLAPKELSLGWTGQVLDRRAGIARIEIASPSKYIDSAVASFPEMEDKYSNKSKQSSNVIKRTIKSINQRKQKKHSKHLNSEKPVDLVKETPKSHILKVYEKSLQKQENEIEKKQTGITKNIDSKYLETKKAGNLQKEENSIDKSLSVPLELTTANNVETFVQTHHDHREYNMLQHLGQQNINQVNSKLSNSQRIDCEENYADSDKLDPNQSKIFPNTGTIPSYKLLNISNATVNQEAIGHTNIEGQEKNPLKCLQSLPVLINTNNITESCLGIHKKPPKSPEITFKPVTINKKKNKVLIKRSPKTSKNVYEDVHHHSSSVNKGTTDIYSSSMNLTKTKEIKRNNKELETTQKKANNKTFIVDKPQPISGGVIKNSAKEGISDGLFRRSKQKINSFSYNERIPNEKNSIKKQIVENKKSLRSDIRHECYVSDQSSIKVKSPKTPTCTITHCKTPVIEDHVLKRELLNDQHNKPLIDVKKIISDKDKLNDETGLKNKSTQNIIMNKLGLKGLNGITEYINEKEYNTTYRDLMDKNMHKGIEKPKENELKKIKSMTTKQKINNQDRRIVSISQSEGLSNNIKHKTSTPTLKSQQKETDEAMNFNLQVRNEDIYGNVHSNKKENVIHCVEKLNENKLKGKSTILKPILPNNKTKLFENDSLYSTLVQKPNSKICKTNTSKNQQKDLDLDQNNQVYNISPINNNVTEIKTPNILKSSRLKQIIIRKTALKSEESLHQTKRKNREKSELGKDKKHLECLQNTNIVDIDYQKINNFKKSCENLNQVDNTGATRHNTVLPYLIQEPLVGKRKLNSRQNSPTSEGKSDVSENTNKNIVKNTPDTTDKTSNVLNFIDMASFVSKNVKREHVLNIPDLDSSKGRKLHSRKPESPKVFLKKYGENKQIHNLAEPNLRSLRTIQVVKKKSKNSKLLREEYSKYSTNSVKDNNRPTVQRSDIIIPSKMHTRNYCTMENKTNLALNYLWKRYASTLNMPKKTIIPVDAKRNSHIITNHVISKHYSKKSKALKNAKKEGYKIEIQVNKTKIKIQNKNVLNQNEELQKKTIPIKKMQDPALLKLKEVKGDSHIKTISHTNFFRPKIDSLPLNRSQPVNKQCDIEILYKKQHKDNIHSEDNEGKKNKTEIIQKPSAQYDNKNCSYSQFKMTSTKSKHSSQNIKTNVQSAGVKKVPAQERLVLYTTRSSSEISPLLSRNRIETTASMDKCNLKSPQSRNPTKLQQLRSKTKELPAIEHKFSECQLSKSQKLNNEFNKNANIQITTAKSVGSIKKDTKSIEYSKENSINLVKLNRGLDETISKKPLKWKSKNARLSDWTADEITEEITTTRTQQTGKFQAKKRTSIKSNIFGVEQSNITHKSDISTKNAHKNIEHNPINQSHQNENENPFEESKNNKTRLISPEKHRQNDSQSRTKPDIKEDGATCKTTFLRNEENIINTRIATNSHSNSEIPTKIKINSNENNTNDSIAILKIETCKEQRINIDKNIHKQEKTSTARLPLNITGTTINKKILIKRGEFKRNTPNIDNFKTYNLAKTNVKSLKTKEEKNYTFKSTANTNNTISSLDNNISTENTQPVDKKNITDESELKIKSSDQTINKSSPRTITSQSSHILETLMKPVSKKSGDIPYHILKSKQLDMSLPKPKKDEYEYLNKLVNYMNKRSITLRKGSGVNQIFKITDNSNKNLSSNTLQIIEPIKSYKETQGNKQTNIKGINSPNFKKPVQNLPRDQLRDNIKPILVEKSKRFSLTNDEIRKLSSKISSSGYKNLISNKNIRNVQNATVYQSARNVNAMRAFNIHTKENLQPVEKYRYFAEFPLNINLPIQNFEGNSTPTKSDTSLSNTNTEILKEENIEMENCKKFNPNQTKSNNIKSWRPRRSYTMIGEFPKETIQMNA